MAQKRQTLLYVFDEDATSRQVLLGRKLRGFGQGKIMAPGGHVEAGESDAEAAIRELWEETGLRVAIDDAEKRAELTYRLPTHPEWDATVAVFVALSWTGEPTRSDELDPVWFPADDPPLDLMWDDERYWLPLVLAGRRLAASFAFDEDGNAVTEHEIGQLSTEDEPRRANR